MCKSRTTFRVVQRLAPKRLAELARDVAYALDYAHQHGIIHRDVKPANLILDRADTIWITDFGLARLDSQINFQSDSQIDPQIDPQADYRTDSGTASQTDSRSVRQSNTQSITQTKSPKDPPFNPQRQLTQVGDIVGTLRYVAPEQLDGVTAPSCDIYGLGVTLYELATLRPAWSGDAQGKILVHLGLSWVKI